MFLCSCPIVISFSIKCTHKNMEKKYEYFGFFSFMCKNPPSQNCFMLKMMCFYSSHASIPVFVFSIVSPRVNRTNLFTSIFSPIVAIVCFNKSLTRILSFLMKGCSRRASSLSIFETLPSTIFSLMFSGFDRRSSSLCISSSLSLFTKLSGMFSMDTNCTFGQTATCIARSSTKSLKFSLLQTKSVSQFTSIKTPIWESWM